MTNNHIEFHAAVRSQLPDIISLLANDELGHLREDTRDPVAAVYVEAFSAIDADPNQFLAVAIDTGGAVVGTLQISFLPGISRMGSWRGQIEAVRVADTHRNAGLGGQMFEWAIAQCKSRGCNLVQLTTDKARPDAHRFYEKLGFIASHTGYKLKI